jgi:hypothetical protein
MKNTNTMQDQASQSADYHIPCLTKMKWLNHPKVQETLGRFLKPKPRGRKGYGKILLFLWLVWKQISGCTYRDLECLAGGIDHSTFIKFKRSLVKEKWFPKVFEHLAKWLVSRMSSLGLALDSTFVPTYSGKHESGSRYSGYKEKIGFKLHTFIDCFARLPLAIRVSDGARHDVVGGAKLIGKSPPKWKVKFLTADKGYDSEEFVELIRHHWQGAKICIPLRRMKSEGRDEITPEREGWRRLKTAERTLTKELRNIRTAVERYFSRKKGVFKFGEQRTRGIKAFRTECYLTAIAEYLEFIGRFNLTYGVMKLFFTKLN